MTGRYLAKPCAALLVLASTLSQASASSITISDPFIQWFNVGPNNLGFSSGEIIRYGADSVVPNGVSGGTTGVATTINAATGQTITRILTGQTSPGTPNFFQGNLAICTTSCGSLANNNPANLTNPWTLTFNNPNTSPTSAHTTVSLAGQGEIPFVQSVTLSGTGQTPTFSWAPPPGTTVEGYRINIYQNNLITFSNGHVVNNGLVVSTNLSPSITSYSVTPSDFTIPGTSLQSNTQYTIEINALQTRNGSSTNLLNGNVQALSRVYSNFQILPNGTPPVNLPTTTVSNGQITYGFNLTVAPGVTYNIDPASAIGYIFRTGLGDPNFASVTLPTGNSGLYELLLWNGTSWAFDANLAGGQLFNFGGTGVSEFEVLGINPGLDPNNPVAFITALTFEGAGNFTGTMTPVTAAVPEPSTWAMMILGFCGVGFMAYRRRNIAGIVN
ncbi:hypothetical protein GCM10010987_74420 [Bradyrhizobium guangdongense]|nr:PEPxxWA-CTERM sorting domain-containing protein [Bradyrhizobium guangdongense]GGI33444.1 hypothetical protein GCM10010987_74420 [Bradyrhizobium guangdongense]